MTDKEVCTKVAYAIKKTSDVYEMKQYTAKITTACL